MTNRVPRKVGWAAKVLSPTGCLGTSLFLKLPPQDHHLAPQRPIDHAAQTLSSFEDGIEFQ